MSGIVSSLPGNLIQGGRLIGADFNSTADQAIPVFSPTPYYQFNGVFVTNPSTSLTTAVGGVYSAASKGGVPVVGVGQAYAALNGAAVNTNGSLLIIGNAVPNVRFNVTTFYLSLTTPQGGAATADIYILIRPIW